MAQSVDLNRIQLFSQVVLAGSFTKAALLLKQPKSRISRQIASLERELGVQLIYRTTRQFQLTEAGRDFFQKAKSHIDELETAVQSVGLFSEQISGLIRVTAPEDVGVQLLCPISRDFMNLYPQVSIELVLANELLDLVKESMDLAVRASQIKDSSMILKKIGFVNFIFVASPQLLNRRGGVPEVQDLESWPFLKFTPIYNKKGLTLSNRKEKKVFKLPSQFMSNNFLVIREMALLGQGLALIPSFLAQEAIRDGQLVHVLKDWSYEGAPIQLLMPSQKLVLPRVRRFSEFLSQRLGEIF